MSCPKLGKSENLLTRSWIIGKPATAFEAQLQQTKEQAAARLEVRKKTLNEALEKFKSEVATTKRIAGEKKGDTGTV